MMKGNQGLEALAALCGGRPKTVDMAGAGATPSTPPRTSPQTTVAPSAAVKYPNPVAATANQLLMRQASERSASNGSNLANAIAGTPAPKSMDANAAALGIQCFFSAYLTVASQFLNLCTLCNRTSQLHFSVSTPIFVASLMEQPTIPIATVIVVIISGVILTVVVFAGRSSFSKNAMAFVEGLVLKQPIACCATVRICSFLLHSK